MNKRIVTGAAVFLIALTAALYAPVTGFNFVNLDDPYLVQTNVGLLRPLQWDTLFRPVAGLYHPLTNLTYWIDAQRAGLDPHAFHLTNLLFHLVATVFMFLWACGLSRSWLAGLALACAFSWHPTHLESVAWISERKDVVSVAFFWMFLGAHLYAVRTGQRRWWIATLCALGLSLLGKPFALGGAALMVLVEWRAGSLKPLAIVRARAPWLGLALVMGAAAGLSALLAQNEVRRMKDPSFWDMLLALPGQFGFYIYKTLWPFGLKPLYTYGDLEWTLAMGAAVGAYMIACALCAWRSQIFRRDLIFGWLFFGLIVAPMLKWVPFGDGSPVADRYLYVSQMGLLWPWALAAARFAVIWDPRPYAAAAVLGFWFWATWDHLPAWENPETLWERVLAQEPDNLDAHENLGRYYLGQERHELSLKHLSQGKTYLSDNIHNRAFVLMRLKRLDEADALLRQAEQRNPNEAKILNLRGSLYLERDDFANAELYFRKSMEVPEKLLSSLVQAEAQTNLGILEYRRGKFDECVKWQNESLQSLPNYVYAIHNRALCFLALKRVDEAKRDYERTLELAPTFAMAHNGLGVIAMQSGDLDRAERHFRDALANDPNLQLAKGHLELILKVKSANGR